MFYFDRFVLPHLKLALERTEDSITALIVKEQLTVPKFPSFRHQVIQPEPNSVRSSAVRRLAV